MPDVLSIMFRHRGGSDQNSRLTALLLAVKPDVGQLVIAFRSAETLYLAEQLIREFVN